MAIKLRGLVLGAKAHELFNEGLTNRQVAEALGQNFETVRKARAAYERFLEDSGGLTDIEPRKFAELEPKFQAMTGPYLAFEKHRRSCLDPSTCDIHEALCWAAVDGYELFFNEFNWDPETNQRRIMAPHAREWIHDAFYHRRLLLNVPPRHAKSTYMSVWLPMFLVCCDRDIQILLISQTDDFAEKFCLEIVAHFEGDEALIKAFGRFVPTDGSPWAPRNGELMVAGRARLVNPGDRTIQIRGAKQQILGMEADWLIGDDPDSPDIVRSDVNRARFREWWDMQVMTRLSPKSRAICIGQRLHINDLYGYLGKKTRSKIPGNPKMWQNIQYPAVTEWPSDGKEAKVLWPEVWPYDELMFAYDELGEYGFESMYQQHPTPRGARIVKQEWIEGDETHRGCLDRDRAIGEGWRNLTGDQKPMFPVTRVLSVDPSVMNNWGYVVADTLWTPDHKQFNASVLHVEGSQHSIPEAKHRIEFLMSVYAPIDYFVWEWSSISNWLESDPWYNELRSKTRVMGHKTHGHSKGDAEYGVQSMAIEFEFGRIRFPYATAESRSMTDAFLTELYAWPDGEYDDRLMALWFVKYVHRSLYPTHETPSDSWAPVGTAFDVDPNGAWDW